MLRAKFSGPLPDRAKFARGVNCGEIYVSDKCASVTSLQSPIEARNFHSWPGGGNPDKQPRKHNLWGFGGLNFRPQQIEISPVSGQRVMWCRLTRHRFRTTHPVYWSG
jgi:hypothetical protein